MKNTFYVIRRQSYHHYSNGAKGFYGWAELGKAKHYATLEEAAMDFALVKERNGLSDPLEIVRVTEVTTEVVLA